MINLIDIEQHRSHVASDEALKEISKDWILVSSKQLAKFLGKKNDNSLRAARSKRTGFKAYKDPVTGDIYYNLIEVIKQLTGGKEW